MQCPSGETSTEWSPATDVTDGRGTPTDTHALCLHEPASSDSCAEPRDEITAQNHARALPELRPQDLAATLLRNRYRLGELIGRGVGRVHAAHDTHLDEPCVIKTVMGARNCARLQREVLLGQLCQKVPGLVRIRDRGEDPIAQVSSVVFDYLDGENLEQRLLHGPLPWPEAIAIGSAAAQTLADMHALGVIHRDIKPANVFLCRDGDVRVLDLGLACMPGLVPLTREGAILGSPPYTSPEQLIHASEVDGRTDVYGLGLVLAYAIGGETMLPSLGSELDPAVLLANASKRKSLATLAPALPPAVIAVVERACQPDPAARFASMAEFAAALSLLRESTASARPSAPRNATSRHERIPNPPRRRRWPRYVLVGTLATLGLFPWLVGALLLLQGVDLPRQLGLRNPQSRWQHAHALAQAGLTATAAKTFEQIAAHADPFWRAEALRRATALRSANEDRKQSEAHALAAGRALLSGEPAPLYLVARFPGHMRRAFYDAVRGAPDAERVRALLPLGQALDQHSRSDILVPYLQQIATRPFTRRAKLAAVYAKLLLDYNMLSRPAQDEYFRELRATHQDDLLMGALVLTDRVGDHLEEYQKLAEATGDPWFMIHALHEQARAEQQLGHDAQAEQLLWTAIDQCERHQVAYRCIQVELELATFYRLRQKWIDAEELARRAWKRAGETGAWQAELSALSELRSIAVLRGDTARAESYQEEYRERDPKGCQHELALRVDSAAVALDALRIPDARRALQEAARCHPPLGLKHLTVLVHLDRLGMPVVPLPELTGEIERTRLEGGLGPSDLALLDAIEGVLLLHHRRADGLAKLQAVTVVASQLPAWNLNARTARADAYEALIFDAAQHADLIDALRLAQESIDGSPAPAGAPPATRPQPPAAPSPGQCMLGIFVSYERRLVVLRDERGQVRGQQAVQRSVQRDSEGLVSAELQTALRGCHQVTVYTPPELRGDSQLLDPQIAWAYHAPHTRAAPPARDDLLVVDVAPADRAQAGIMEQARTISAFAWLMPGTEPAVPLQFQSRSRRLQDGQLRPTVSELDGSYPLIAAELAGRKLGDAPLVIWHAAPGVSTHPPAGDLASAYLAAGARGVLSVGPGVGTARANAWLMRVLVRVQGGEPLPEALRNERVLALQDNLLWVKEVIAYQ